MSMDGWSLLYKTIENDIQRKSDVLIAVAHWQLLRQGLKCIGIGEDRELSPSDVESELLPDGWNMNTNSYAIRYKCGNYVLMLLGTVVEGSILLNLFNAKTSEVTNASFPIDGTIKMLKGPLPTLIPEIDAVLNRLQKELFENAFTKPKSAETQTVPEPKVFTDFPFPRDPGRWGPMPRGDFARDLRNVGRHDLHPFGPFGTEGGSGGGMLFNPPGLRNPHAGHMGGHMGGQTGRLPGIIPEARFDPFNPPEVERQRRRNSRDFDHFRPPGGTGSSFYDDMFM